MSDSPGITPHIYVPAFEVMGDCAVCGWQNEDQPMHVSPQAAAAYRDLEELLNEARDVLARRAVSDTLSTVLDELGKRFPPPSTPAKPPKKQLYIHKPIEERARHPGDGAIVQAVVEEAGEDGWANPWDVADRLFAARSTAVRWCRSLVQKGLLEEGRGYSMGRYREESFVRWPHWSRSVVFRAPSSRKPL